jgi:hypothetical protein
MVFIIIIIYIVIKDAQGRGRKNWMFAAIRKKPKKNLIHFHLFFKYKIFFFFLGSKNFFFFLVKIFFFFWSKIFFFLGWLDKSGPKISFGSCLGVPVWLPTGSVPPGG